MLLCEADVSEHCCCHSLLWAVGLRASRTVRPQTSQRGVYAHTHTQAHMHMYTQHSLMYTHLCTHALTQLSHVHTRTDSHTLTVIHSHNTLTFTLTCSHTHLAMVYRGSLISHFVLLSTLGPWSLAQPPYRCGHQGTEAVPGLLSCTCMVAEPLPHLISAGSC